MSLNLGSSTASLISQLSLTPTSLYTAETDPYTGKTTYVYNAPSPVAIDTTTLENALAVSSGTASSSTANSSVPVAVSPWSSSSNAPQQSALVAAVSAGATFFNPSSAQLAAPAGAHQQDYEALFGLYQGLNAMEGLASASAASTSTTQQAAYQTTFANGVTQLQSYISSGAFKTIDVAYGALNATQQSSQGAPVATNTYTTQPLATGSVNTAVPAFAGNVAFNLQVASLDGKSQTIAFNLADMGSTTRSLGNVISYLNSKLQAAGVATRFADVLNPGTAQTATINGVSTTIGTNPDTYSLQIVGSATEQLTFSAADATPAVYLTGSQGAPGVATTSITASSTGPTITTTTSPSDVTQITTEYNGASDAVATSATDGLVTQTTIANSPTNVVASATGSDGSLYVLANIDGKTANGQTIDGSSDVALMKYDSAGNLLYTQTLGAANAASGYALAVSPDGSQVAITGTTTGPLDATDSTQASTATTGFVSVYSAATGDEQWTQTQSQPDGTTQTPTAVTFGSNGQVYVAGTTSGALLGTGSFTGTQDSYVAGYTGQQITAPDGTTSWVSGATFTQTFGDGEGDKPAAVAVSGNTLYTAGSENGDAVVRAYTLNGSSAPTLTATQNLGSLGGGQVAGLSVASDGSVIVGGSTSNGALAGTVGQAYASGYEGFVATLSAGLTPTTMNYVQTPSNFTATSMTTSNGSVYLAGSISEAPQTGQTTGSAGYVAEVAPTTGQVQWSRTQQGVDGIDAPTSVAVSQGGASSSLNALGLPSGAIDFTPSTSVITASSVRAGDSFQVKVGSGPATTVTIQEGDTFQTLAQKIEQASGYAATVTTPTVSGKTVLKIAPASPNQSVTLIAGASGEDALAPLGLRAGELTDDANDTGSSGQTLSKQTGARSILGLVLPATLNISTAAGAKAAVTALQLSIAKVENLYTDMSRPASTTSSSTSTLSPALQTYYSNQLANYQLALQRLGG